MDYLDDGSGRRNAPNRGKSYSTKAASKIKAQTDKRVEQSTGALSSSSDDENRFMSKKEKEAQKRLAKIEKQKEYEEDQKNIAHGAKGKKHHREESLL
jgi:hypothetical protein